MARRLSRRDVALLGLVTLSFVLLAIQLPFGTRGFDRPQLGAHWRVLEAPGRALGWGGVAILLLVVPYTLVAWLKGRLPGRAVSALGALVFGVGVGGLAGLWTSPPAHGGGVVGGALAHLLGDALGTGVATAVLGAIAIPGLFLSLAPLLLETGYVAGGRPTSGAAVPPTPTSLPAGRAPVRTTPGAAPRPPVLTKSPYPERRVGPDGEELPMQLPGTDVGPIRYRDPTPAAGGSTGPDPTPAVATRPPDERPAPRPIPVAGPPPPASSPTRKGPVISGVRYKDEAPAPPVPLVAPDPAFADRDAKPLPAGVRFAPPPPPPVEIVPPPEPVPTPPPAPVVIVAPPVPAEPAVETPAPATPPAPAPAPAPATATATAPADVTAAPPSETSAPSATDGGGSEAVPAPVLSTHPSVVGHRRKLAESGIFEGTSPAADRPGRPPKPKPRAATAKDWREALHGLFSSLPVEELPPIRVPDDLVGRSAEELAAEDAAARIDPPGQMRLFDASAPGPEGGSGPRDVLFDASVEAAIERGSASLVLLKRRLGIGYARAAALIDALVAEGALGEMTASGSRPTLWTAAEWNRRRGARAPAAKP